MNLLWWGLWVSGREGDAAAAWLQPPSQTSCVPMDIKLQSNTTIIIIIVIIIFFLTGPKSDHCLALSVSPCSCWIVFKSDFSSCYMDFFSLLDGFVKINNRISLICYMDWSKLMYGFLWVFRWICKNSTWISLSCNMNLSKLFHAFVALFQTKSNWSLTKILKLFEASLRNANWSFDKEWSHTEGPTGLFITHRGRNCIKQTSVPLAMFALMSIEPSVQ